MNTQSQTMPGRWFVGAILLVFVIWLATVLAVSREPAAYGVSVAAGESKFRDHCGACHIVEKGITTHHGPNLYDFGKIAGTRKPGLTAAQYVLESVLDPEAFVAAQNRHGMPRNLASNFTEADLRNIVAYVVSRGANANFEEISKLPIPDTVGVSESRVVRREDMELAERVLRERGGCLQCHALYRNAEYTIFAPALFGVGLSDEALLRESIVDPNKVISPAHRWVNVMLTSGKVESGKIVGQSPERILLVKRGDANDLVQVVIARDEIDEVDGQLEITTAVQSPMPTGLDKLLSEHELDVLIRMIRQLN
ncbi:MAG: c-type cytochrome [Planctomycetales bacterium]|nr:c-type cytochrome [Planctomycetales bacterium]